MFGCDVFAIDKYPMLVERLRANGINFNLFDLAHGPLPFDDEFFDVVLNCEVIEHLFSLPYAMFYEMYRVLKRNGKLILSTPNLYSLVKRIRFFVGKRIIPPLSYPEDEPFSRASSQLVNQDHSLVLSRLSKRNEFGHTHFREYDIKELSSLASEAGFNIKLAFYPKTHGLFTDSNSYDLNPYHVIYRFLTLMHPPWRHFILILAEKK
jgi:SAM-dependent methyltransferase